jgi:hypothetical protein
MQWIEDLLGVSPDGGNGLFESLVVVLVVCAVLLVSFREMRFRSSWKARLRLPQVPRRGWPHR